jgi:hypothetical protein
MIDHKSKKEENDHYEQFAELLPVIITAAVLVLVYILYTIYN